MTVTFEVYDHVEAMLLMMTGFLDGTYAGVDSLEDRVNQTAYNMLVCGLQGFTEFGSLDLAGLEDEAQEYVNDFKTKEAA